MRRGTSPQGYLGAGPRVGTDGVGEYKTLGMQEPIRAQRGRARSALFYRVILVHVGLHIHVVWQIDENEEALVGHQQLVVSSGVFHVLLAQLLGLKNGKKCEK